MTGKTHAATGALTALALAPAAISTGLPIGGPALALWVALATIGALMPDLDEPQSIAGRRSLGLAHIVRWAAGGHREGTHDIILAPLTWLALGTIAGLALGTIAGLATGPWWAGIPLALGVAVGILGDALTIDGAPVPFTWWRPGKAPRWGPRLFRTGNKLAETTVTAITGAIAAAAWLPHVPSL